MPEVIRDATPQDAQSIADIYNHYIVHTPISFEEHAISADEVGRRLAVVTGDRLPWLVAEADGSIVGYAYAGKWKPRSAYRHSVEVSVYVKNGCSSRGIGTRLYTHLFDRLRNQSIRIAIGGMTLPNPASQALHEKFGMKKVAHFERVGFKFDEWWDVGYWQLDLAADELAEPTQR